MRPIKVSFRRVGLGFKFVVEDTDMNQYEQYVHDEQETLLIAVTNWLKKREYFSFDKAMIALSCATGVVFSFNVSMPEFMDYCPLADLRSPDEFAN